MLPVCYQRALTPARELFAGVDVFARVEMFGGVDACVVCVDACVVRVDAFVVCVDACVVCVDACVVLIIGCFGMWRWEVFNVFSSVNSLL